MELRKKFDLYANLRPIKTYPGIPSKYDNVDLVIDAMCMRLVQYPERYDILVLPNLYGDIVSDLCAGLVGGIGVTPGANIGTDISVFEAIHGTAPDIAGKGIANPIALILSGVMMLRQLNEADAAERVEQAINKTLQEGKHLTSDLGGKSTTNEFADAIIENMDTIV